ncbi:MAG: S-adenosylmethionine decarboxylase [Bacteroidetes bacterium]|nr:S-adenosylmethionine decarboxylase [Bacteroidota bacterium]
MIRMVHKHSILDLYDCSPEIFVSISKGKKVLREACKKAKLNVVGEFGKVYPGGGYSCGLFLSESHISIHTWPELFYCAIDIFICKGKSFISEKEIIRQIKPKKINKQRILRGEYNKLEFNKWIRSNQHNEYFEAFRSENEIIRHKSKFQLIEIIKTKAFGKILFLDGDIQVATSDERIYHEQLVHPAVLAHQNPRKVLLLGGGDGGALREILRYPFIEEVTMVEIDNDVVKLCCKFLPEINEGAFESSRVNIKYMDASEYLGTNKYDVIISDLTAPSGPSLNLYNDLISKFKLSMRKDTIVSLHSGWWSNSIHNNTDIAVCNNFENVILTNKWINSFSCFWSFLVCWDHDVSTKEMLLRIKENSRNLKGVKFFLASEFLREAFMPIKYEYGRE